MKYVGLCTYQDSMYALREDGWLYRIKIDWVTQQAAAIGCAPPPVIERLLNLSIDQ